MRAKIWLPVIGILAGGASCWLLGNKDWAQSEGAPSASVVLPLASVQSPLLRLGQTAELPIYRAKLVSQRDCGPGGGPRPRATNRSWAVELEVTNTSSSEPLAVNPFYATLEDDQHYKYTTSLVGCSPLLAAKILEPGESVRGYVPFELPAATPTVRLSYHPALPGNRSYAARFDIEL